jgi:hypothetical protein
LIPNVEVKEDTEQGLKRLPKAGHESPAFSFVFRPLGFSSGMMECKKGQVFKYHFWLAAAFVITLLILA